MQGQQATVLPAPLEQNKMVLFLERNPVSSLHTQHDCNLFSSWGSSASLHRKLEWNGEFLASVSFGL